MDPVLYRMLDIDLHLQAPGPLVEFFDSLYGRFRESCGCAICRGATRRSVEIRVTPVSDVAATLSTGGGLWTVANELLPSTLFFLIQNRVVGQVREFFCVHGAAFEIRGRGCIVVAASATGKTTLALELLARGHGFLSDEVAALHVRSSVLHGFPRNLAVRGGSLDLPEGPRPPVARRVWIAGEEKAVVDAGWGGGCVPHEPVAPDVVILLDRPTDASVAVGAEEAILELHPGVEGDGFFDALSELESVHAVERMESPFDGIRVRHTRGVPLISRINRLAEQTGTILQGHHRGASLPIDYSDLPVAEPLSARDGVLQLLPSVLNAGPSAGAAGEWVFMLSRVLWGTRFYRMIPGRLGATADALEKLCSEG